MAALAQVITGKVAHTSRNGFLLEGSEDWLTISKFGTPKPELPEVGQQVTATLDAQGYVRALEPAMNTHGPASPPPHAATPGVCLSLRVAALQAATTFCASRPDARSEGVLEVAARFEAWLTR